MKKQIALLFSMVAIAAFLLVNVANAQSPKTAAKDVAIEKTTDTKAPCAGESHAPKADCGSKTDAAKKDCTPEQKKSCGGCPSKAAAKPAEPVPAPKK